MTTIVQAREQQATKPTLAQTVEMMRPEIARAIALCDTKATADGEVARENRERLASAVEQSPGDTARILRDAGMTIAVGTDGNTLICAPSLKW